MNWVQWEAGGVWGGETFQLCNPLRGDAKWVPGRKQQRVGLSFPWKQPPNSKLQQSPEALIEDRI